jgi:DNA-binding CsgD family transcriptional regulator
MSRLGSLPPRVGSLEGRTGSLPKETAPFYLTPEWRALVERIITIRSRRCQDPKCKSPDCTNRRIFGDHIKELKDGGAPLDPDNILLRCSSCHVLKGNRGGSLRPSEKASMRKIPIVKRSVGRPNHVALKENRDRVMWRRAMGWSESEIADELGISRNTLDKHYAKEMRTAKLRKQGEAMDLLVNSARNGNSSSIKTLFLLMNDPQRSANLEADKAIAEAKAPKLGKKEIANIQAHSAAVDTSWEGKMRRIQEIGTSAPAQAIPKPESTNGSAGGPPPTVN